MLNCAMLVRTVRRLYWKSLADKLKDEFSSNSFEMFNQGSDFPFMAARKLLFIIYLSKYDVYSYQISFCLLTLVFGQIVIPGKSIFHMGWSRVSRLVLVGLFTYFSIPANFMLVSMANIQCQRINNLFFLFSDQTANLYPQFLLG